MNIQTAQSINQEVRRFFSLGYKSSNKAYVPDSTEEFVDDEQMAKLYKAVSNEKWQFREVCRQLPIARLPLNEYYYERGRYINANKVNLRANCGEMATLAFYKVRERGENKEHVMLGRLSGKGDHVFCYVSAQGNPSRRGLMTSVEAMTGDGLVIDPWLNVVCTAANYKTQAIEKFRKWQTEGKRILVLKDASQDKVYWASPLGSYLTNFLQQPLVFSQNKSEHAINLAVVSGEV